MQLAMKKMLEKHAMAMLHVEITSLSLYMYAGAIFQDQVGMRGKQTI